MSPPRNLWRNSRVNVERLVSACHPFPTDLLVGLLFLAMLHATRDTPHIEREARSGKRE